MVAFKTIAVLSGLIAGVSAQAQFGAPENSAQVLAALQAIDASTKASRDAATAFQPNNAAQTQELTYQNYVLRSDWQFALFTAQGSQGFFSESGAQSIIDFITGTLAPDTVAADQVYTDKRDTFIQGGFIDFINSGLIQLRIAVSQTSGAIEAKTPASKLTAMSLALLLIEQNYATTQEYQQFGAFPTVSTTIPCSGGSAPPSGGSTTSAAAPAASSSGNGYGYGRNSHWGRYGGN